MLMRLRNSSGNSAMAGASFSAIATTGSRSHLLLGDGGTHPRSMISLVISTLLGSPRTEPSSSWYYALCVSSREYILIRRLTPAKLSNCLLQNMGPVPVVERGGKAKTVYFL